MERSSPNAAHLSAKGVDTTTHASLNVDSFYASSGTVSGNVSVISTMAQTARENAIVFLAQKRHATYDRDSYGLLLKAIDLISENYLSRRGHADNVDVFIFHTGDFEVKDLEFLESRINSRKGMLKMVNLHDTAYWSLPPWNAKDNQTEWCCEIFPLGYRHMCRFFGIKIWHFFEDMNQQLGSAYRYVLRLDEDSFVLSPIGYDIFDYMKSNQFVYGFRLCAYEMDYNRYIGGWFQQWKRKTLPKREITRDLCGFYNNFFVADIHFFLSPPVQRYLKAIDRQGFVYRKRYGDLMIHSTAVYAFAEPETIHRFLDFTYQHVTTDYVLNPEQGCVVWGGIQAGYNDRDAEQHLDRYLKEEVLNKNCSANSTYLEERDLSPTYQHLPESWRGKVKLRTIIAGKVEIPGQGILSG